MNTYAKTGGGGAAVTGPLKPCADEERQADARRYVTAKRDSSLATTAEAGVT